MVKERNLVGWVMALCGEYRNTRRSEAGLRKIIRAAKAIGCDNEETLRLLTNFEYCQGTGERWNADPEKWQSIIDKAIGRE